MAKGLLATWPETPTGELVEETAAKEASGAIF
jgi:hypothetical protein